MISIVWMDDYRKLKWLSNNFKHRLRVFKISFHADNVKLYFEWLSKLFKQLTWTIKMVSKKQFFLKKRKNILNCKFFTITVACEQAHIGVQARIEEQARGVALSANSSSMRKWTCSDLCKFFFSTPKTAQKITQFSLEVWRITAQIS